MKNKFVRFFMKIYLTMTVFLCCTLLEKLNRVVLGTKT